MPNPSRTTLLPTILLAAAAAAAQVPVAVAPPPAPAAPAMPAAPPVPPLPALTPMTAGTVVYSGQTWLGVGLADLTSATAKNLHLDSERGAEVMEVYPDSPAAAAGLKVNDVIVGYNGQPVASVRELSRLLGETPSDRTVAVAVMRAGKAVKMDVHLAERPSTPTFTFKPLPGPAQAGPLSAPLAKVQALSQNGFYALYTARYPGNLGIAATDLTPQLANYFGLKDGQTGALVSSVTPDSPAAKAGIQAGDVVTRIGSVDIASTRTLLTLGLRDQAVNGKTPVTVVRHGKALTLTMQLPAAISAEDLTASEQSLAQAEKALASAQAELSSQAASDLPKLRADLQRAQQELSVQERKLDDMLRRLQQQNLVPPGYPYPPAAASGGRG